MLPGANVTAKSTKQSIFEAFVLTSWLCFSCIYLLKPVDYFTHQASLDPIKLVNDVCSLFSVFLSKHLSPPCSVSILLGDPIMVAGWMSRSRWRTAMHGSHVAWKKEEMQRSM